MAESHYRILVNTSTLMQGGGLQVATAFIGHAMQDPDTAGWEYMVSRTAAQELTGFGIDISKPCFHIFDKSPARHADERDRVREIEAQMQPDMVFTLFGPAYVKFKARHLCGVADPWVTHSSWLAFKTLGFSFEALKMIGTMAWKALWWKRVDFWWTEAPVAKEGLISRLHCMPEKIFIIPNTVGPQFERNNVRASFSGDGKVRILCLSAYYGHKNLEIIPDVILEVERLRPELDFEFTVTLPEDLPEVKDILQHAERIGVSKRINNLGRVPVSKTPGLYAKSHIAFLPSLLEVFSAVYPESLCTGVPLVTTDLRFARDVCQDAAAYFRPTDARSAAEHIIRLAEDEAYWRQISEHGQEIFKGLPNAGEKWDLQKKVILQAAAFA
ncbi:MAG: glycosyltransferase [Gammaproteobacteria bacterium]|nr:glycosyltransferase [Gammaproteobacteria bacterium]MCP4091689.1 glycosyltransferase [Gammaproteobacteria bacterium]MCP4274996.1 glycosyltransferase [Gammaproteobacteria bacterium]MCP4831819.1 glycosyltransferase [Gammaproteobacteria bacterium]MCP4929755.1 glycosyltransferase [Gammaproteobacteria bacterium]